jgi:biopolymer transport protein ExbD
MAFAFNGGTGLRGRRRAGSGTLSEINVVPLVDVVLVLLIIFMLTAHVMEFGLEVDVPRVKQVRNSTEDLPVITVMRDGEYWLNDQPAKNINTLPGEIERRFGKGQAVYVRADRQTIWDPIAQLISALGEAKIQVRMVTKPEDEADKGRRR